MTPRLGAAIVVIVTGLLCGWLGNGVSQAPPAGIDLAGRALAGHFAHVALVFTASCWWQILVSFGIVGIIVAVLEPALRPRIIFSIVTTLVAWQASDALKNIFARPRPEYWVLHHETTASYPSGHAMFAVVVYGLWSYFIATGSLPRTPRIILSSCFALWALAVIWSRLALGAHYVTDLIGGMLFGIMMLAAGVAVYGRIPELPARR